MKIRNKCFIFIIAIFFSIKPISLGDSVNWIKEKWNNGIKNIKQKYLHLRDIIKDNPKKSIVTLLAAGAGGGLIYNQYQKKEGSTPPKSPIALPTNQETPTPIYSPSSWENWITGNSGKAAVATGVALGAAAAVVAKNPAIGKQITHYFNKSTKKFKPKLDDQKLKKNQKNELSYEEQRKIMQEEMRRKYREELLNTSKIPS